MGRLSEKIKSAAPKRRKLAGLERRWLFNNVSVMVVLAALCLTAFLQTTLLFLGLLTFNINMLLGLGILLSANEVPRIAQQFGLDTSARVSLTSVIHHTTTAVNLTRSVAKAAGK